jgi:hypothetical protein
MSLIPDESYSFPDDFVQTVNSLKKPRRKISLPPAARSGAPREKAAVRPPVKVETPRKNVFIPLAVKPEPPRPARPVPPTPPASSPPPAPPPPVKRAKPPDAAPAVPRVAPVAKREPGRANIPALVHLKRKVRYNTHLAAPAPQQEKGESKPPVAPTNGVIQNSEAQQTRASVQHPVQIPALRPDPVRVPVSRSQQPATPATPAVPAVPVVPAAAARGAPAVSGEEQIEFELLDSFSSTPKNSKRKLLRFLVCESMAVIALVVFALIGLSRTFSGRSASLSVNILTITAAVAATLIPIFFYAIGPTLPREDR